MTLVEQEFPNFLTSGGLVRGLGEDVKIVIERGPGSAREVITSAELTREVSIAAEDLQTLTTARSVLALEADHSIGFIAYLVAAVQLGVPVAPLPPLSSENSAAAHRIAQTVPILQPTIVVGGEMFTRAAGSARQKTANAPDLGGAPREIPDDSCVVQFTSGSTRKPKGCVLSRRAVLRQLEMIRNRLAFGDSSVATSFVPFHHDLGLFATLLAPLVTGGIEGVPFGGPVAMRLWVG